MLNSNLSLRVAGPTLLVSLLLLALCVGGGIFLYAQQATTAAVLGENVNSSQIAHDMENTVNDIVALLKDQNDKVIALNDRLEHQLELADQLADKEEEAKLVSSMRASVAQYQQTLNGHGSRESRLTDALRILETETMVTCSRLEDFNARQIKESEAAHRRNVERVVVGLVGVGTVGALAGLLLGFGVARALRQSIYHLSVRVQDAANKLGQDLPPVAVETDLHDLHQQMHGVVQEIEQVVEKLQQRDREVLRAEQLAAVGQLAAGVAHELRNPLTSIKMLVQAQREETEASGIPAEDLHVIELEIRRMERCLQSFLNFARPPKLERRPIDLRQVVDRTLALIGGRARKQNVKVVFSRPDSAIVVDADGEQIQQLLVNLVLNSLDVLPRGGLLDIELDARDGGQVELRVRDTGPGIAADLAPRLFQPFISTKETGLGLGLVISRRIAEGHGGTLAAENQPSGGACFRLRLPVAEVEALAYSAR